MCALGVVMAFAGCAHRTPVTGPQPESSVEKRALVTGVRLRGVRHVDQAELLQGLATKSSKCRTLLLAPFCLLSRAPVFFDRRYLDPVEFRRDALRIRLYYWRRGYRDATVASRTERTSNGVQVVFDVDEKKPTIVDKLDVEQTPAILTRRTVAGAVQVHAGEPLDLIALDSTIGLLHDALWQRGYADADIELDTTRISNALKSGPVVIVVRPGHLTRVRRIEITGNRKVSTRTIGRLLDFRPGALYRRNDVLGSQRNLWLSGLFSEVDLSTPHTDDSLKVVLVRVTEADMNRLDMSGGVTTADFFQVQSQFTRFNFGGSGRRITLSSTLSNLLASQLNGGGAFRDVTSGAQGAMRDLFLRPTWSMSVDFTQPWFLSSHNQLGASIFSHRRSVPGVVIDRGVGASLALTHAYSPRNNSPLGYTYESTAVDASDVYFCVSYGVCDAPTIGAVSGRNPLSPISSVTQFDQSNDPFAPNRGYKGRVDLEYASRATRSDFHYVRAALTESQYFRVSKRSVLAARIRLGLVHAMSTTNAALNASGIDSTPIIHPRKRFYAGGSQSVRGFAENQLGPRVLTISPAGLTDTSRKGACTVQELQSLTCDPNIAGVSSRDFQPQPLGGTSLAEASIEYRFPLARFTGITGAVFIDGAVLSTREFSNLLGTTGSIAPGFGVRLGTPVGPVRLDLGIRPHLVENLPVITQVTNPDGTLRLVALKTLRRYDPLDSSGSGLRHLLSRLELHLAIGPPF